MYIKILSSNNQSLKDRLKNIVLYHSRRNAAAKSWRKRHKITLSINEDYRKPRDKKEERDHVKLWSRIRGNVNIDTYRICSNLSGNTDPAFVPEEIFLADIEPTINNNSQVNYISNKSFYNRWFTGSLFPKDYFHKIDGEYFDSEYKKLTVIEFKDRLKELVMPVIAKPNKDSYGGKGVKIIEQNVDVLSYCEQNQNVVIQELLSQNIFFQKYNPGSINTIRVYMYKSVSDNEWKFLHAVLRMGKDGSMDNSTSGGIFTLIRKDGMMNGFAVNRYGSKFHTHPNSQYKFDDIIPDFEQLIGNSTHVARQIFLTRIVGLDFCYDNNRIWRIIEINTSGHSIRLAQYHGLPFFGDYTDEVIEYCRKNHWALIGG